VSAPLGVTLFVWQEQPYDAWSQGWESVCVKAADGRAPAVAGVFDWAENAKAWHQMAAGHQIGVFVYCYPDDGDQVGQVLAEHTPWADYVVLDVEDAPGGRWTDDDTRAIVAGVRAHLPGTPVGYCTYPTRAQALDHGVAFDALKGACDFSVPQVYYPYQRGELPQVYADNVDPVLAVAPEDDTGWLATATESVHRAGAVFVWRAGMADTRTWAAQIPHPTPAPPVPAAPDPLRPTAWTDLVADRPFVAWDGTTWWVTDGIWRRPCSEQMAGGLVELGLVVKLWPHCAAETGLATPG
jgi:hypothetical protein